MGQLAQELRKLAKCLKEKSKTTSLKKNKKASKILKAAKSVELLRQRMR